jgi:hypothetical protein
MDPQEQTPPASPETTPPPSSPDVETDPRAALDAGIAEVTEAPEPEAEPPAPEGEPPAEGEPAAAPPAAEAAPDEAAALGLKAKAAERFHELTGQVKELAPIKEAIEKAGLKIEDLPKVAERAKLADELIGMVQETGATPAQYGAALDYLKMVNAAARGDRAAAEAAYPIMQRELEALAQFLGREIPGIHDPLAAHRDLEQAVEAGQIDRARALEVAQARASQHMGEQQRQRMQQEQQQQAEQARAVQALAALEPQLAAMDPHYAIRRPVLNEMAREIRATLPPSQWVPAVQRAHQRLMLLPVAAPQAAPPTAAPTKPPVGPVPLRPTGARPGLAPQTDDPMEALNMGIAAASR